MKSWFWGTLNNPKALLDALIYTLKLFSSRNKPKKKKFNPIDMMDFTSFKIMTQIFYELIKNVSEFLV